MVNFLVGNMAKLVRFRKKIVWNNRCLTRPQKNVFNFDGKAVKIYKLQHSWVLEGVSKLKSLQTSTKKLAKLVFCYITTGSNTKRGALSPGNSGL